MAGTKESAKKGRDTRLARDPDFYRNIGRKNAGIPKPTSGFGSQKIGKDGLTGEQRAKKVGSIGGRKSRSNRG